MRINFKNRKVFWIASTLVIVVMVALGGYLLYKNFKISADTMTDTSSQVNLSKTIPLSPNAPIQSLAVDVKGTLATENDLVRVILKAKDASGNKSNYLVYEDEGFLGDTNFSQTGVGGEAQNLNQAYPIEIDVYKTSGAQINVTNVQTGLASKGVSKSATEIATAQQAQKKSDDDAVIVKINQNNAAKGISWTAGETEISLKSHQQILSMFGGNETNLDADTMRLIYYKSGVFGFGGSSQNSSNQKNATTQSNSSPPRSFSWRNFGGKNWITPVEDQGDFDTCWAFAGVAELETSVNTWYNQILNPDLSEQWAVWIRGIGGYGGGWIRDVFNYAAGDSASQAIPNASQYPYDLGEEIIAPKPFAASSGLKIQAAKGFLATLGHPSPQVASGMLEKALIEHGPMTVGLQIRSILPSSPRDFGHGLLLVGYSTSATGQVIWEFKNSWGSKWGENGYIRAIVPVSAMRELLYSVAPYFTTGLPLDVHCEDNDHDGYYYWGTGPKPSTCPASVTAKAKEDCDDSSSAKGPRDGNDNCTALSIPLKVSLAAPKDGAVVVFGQDVTLRAIATTTGPHPIQKVAFYDGTQQIGEVTNTPYNFVWQQPSDGPHSIIAQATDTAGKTTKSAIANITMDAPPQGYAKIESSRITTGHSYVYPRSVRASVGQKLQILAVVAFWDYNANVAWDKNFQLQLYEDGKLIASSAKYSSLQYNWTAGPLGTHTFDVKVTDSLGFTNAGTMASSAL